MKFLLIGSWLFFMCTCIFGLIHGCTKLYSNIDISQKDSFQEYAGDSVINLRDWYDTHRVFYQGHVWIPILIEHHPECPCKEK